MLHFINLTSTCFAAICTLPADSGPCRRKSPILMWHYNSTLKMCQVFPYGGCRGNGNKFHTQAECKRHCGAHMASLEASRNKNTVEIAGNEIQISMKRKKNGTSSVVSSNSATGDDTVTEDAEKAAKKKKKQMRKRKNRRKNKNRRRKQRKPIDPSLPMVDCQVSDWSNWTPCSVTCGKGFITKTRTVIVRPENGGRKCPKKLRRKRKCKAAKCPVNCEVGEWGTWSACSETCGKNSVQKRRRKITRRPKFGGMDCPARKEKRFCKLGMCPNTAEIERMMRDAIYSNPSMFPSK
ncbi:hypothetical protein KUTeg_006687 [Tegillarca granosa]|uniref:BPTI/Kunitz inhibitor domain-containing protein n=1 Tax=Tegillarca granosa TaxID=220873 RepID=A0ABQ9FDH1_TEGGR|nr:hypothetical protein KUTeg_006687 [Tegillarca granosa]